MTHLNRQWFTTQNKYSIDAKDAKVTDSFKFLCNDAVENKQWMKYEITLLGVLLNGERRQIRITDVIPYFTVLMKTPVVTSGGNGRKTNKLELKKESLDIIAVIQEHITKTINNKSAHGGAPDIIKSWSVIEGKPFGKFQEHKSNFLKVEVATAQARKVCLTHLKEKKYVTFHNDNNYKNTVSRDYGINFNSWITINNHSSASPVIDVHMSDLEEIEDQTKFKDMSLIMCWDIETYSPDGSLPIATNPDHIMFMISLIFRMNTVVKKLCLTTTDYRELKTDLTSKLDYELIHCHDERDLIQMWIRIVGNTKPDFIVGFNDSDYDWKWLITRLIHYKLLTTFYNKIHVWHDVYLLNKSTENAASVSKMWISKGAQADDGDQEDNNTVVKSNSYRASRPTWGPGSVAYMPLFAPEQIKIDAQTTATGFAMRFSGTHCIDLRTVLRQLDTAAEESSLKYFLGKYKLGTKGDVSPAELHAAYREFMAWKTDAKDAKNAEELKVDLVSIARRMLDVTDYCVIDSDQCDKLFQKVAVLMDRRSTARMSFTSLFDALYRAGGMKVCSLVITTGQRFGYQFNTTGIIEKEVYPGKYPGAYVFPPIVGTVISKLSMQERIDKIKLTDPVQYNRFVSLKPYMMREIRLRFALLTNDSLPCGNNADSKDNIEDNNLPPLKNKEDQAIVRYEVDRFWNESTGYPVSGLDFASLYPSLIMTYNLSPEKIVTDAEKEVLEKVLDDNGQPRYSFHEIDFVYGMKQLHYWSVWHDNDMDPRGKTGLYPYILNDIFQKRKVVKNELKKYKKIIELLDKKYANYDTGNANQQQQSNMPPDVAEERDHALYMIVCLNSRQMALKLYMNTFYGEAGNRLSPFYQVGVAGGVTSSGRHNLKFAESIVRQLGCRVYYGDTDSLYISPADHVFYPLDALYYTEQIDKKEYWTRMVTLTFDEIAKIRDIVNKGLAESTKTSFLTMAYEEVLYPMTLFAKKMYYGIPHEEVVNFAPKSLFIKGLTLKKRGSSKFMRDICNDILWQCVRIDNLKTMQELVIDKISEVYSNTARYPASDFVSTAVFRPEKKNVRIHTFVQNMKTKYGITIKPNERFEIVVADVYPYRMGERKEELPMGERIELAEHVRTRGVKINIDHYMQNSVNGQLARFIAYSCGVETKDNKNIGKIWCSHADAAAVVLAANSDVTILSRQHLRHNEIREEPGIDKAKTVIENLCKEHYKVYEPKNQLYKSLKKHAHQICGDLLAANSLPSGIKKNKSSLIGARVGTTIAKIKKAAASDAKVEARLLIKTIGEEVNCDTMAYASEFTKESKALSRRLELAEQWLITAYNALTDIETELYNACIQASNVDQLFNNPGDKPDESVVLDAARLVTAMRPTRKLLNLSMAITVVHSLYVLQGRCATMKPLALALAKKKKKVKANYTVVTAVSNNFGNFGDISYHSRRNSAAIADLHIE